MLGGSSSENGMLYVKGNTEDYRRWYAAGNEDWSLRTVEKYFKKAEGLQNRKLLQNLVTRNEYGLTGPLVIQKFNNTVNVELTENIMNSWDEIGIKRVFDLNTANMKGCARITCTAANGIRVSSATAYLNTIKNRSNLKVMKNTLATKILLNAANRAYGVEVEREGRKLTFLAKKEVIISAGTINTPQLLMLSGIGPREHLNSKNITVKVESPMVGQNLQDHATVGVTFYTNGPFANVTTQYFYALQYLYNRTGPLAKNSFADIFSFYSGNKNALFPEYQNHVQFYFKNDSSLRNLYSNVFSYKAPVVESIVELNKKYVTIVFLFNLLHPLSRGNISLASNDPKVQPLIYPNYFLNPKDLDSAVRGIKIITKIVNTKYFKSVQGFLGRINWPPCNKYELDSYDYWKCISLNTARTVHHQVGTSKMGPDPETSVVSSKLKVYGVTDLRVIDASIMPTIISGNTNGPTTMIAERGADLVKETYNRH